MAVGTINTQADPTESRSGAGWEQQITTNWRQDPTSGYWFKTSNGVEDPTPYAYPVDGSGRAVDPTTGMAFSGQGGVNSGGGNGGGLPWGSVLKWSAPGMVAGAAQSYMQNRQANAAREEAQRESNQRTAVQESQLDPFRGLMYQTRDVGEMERRLNGPRSYRPSLNSPANRYFNLGNMAPPLSDTYRTSLTNAQQMIARGEGTVPTMLNESNWGSTGTSNLLDPNAPAAPAARPRYSPRLRR